VLMSQKVPFDKISKTIEWTTGVPGRLEEISNNNGYKIFVDYAHTEESLRSVLETLKKTKNINRLVLVFGATGDRDKGKRPKMWRVADSLADVIILTDDDTYSEDSLAIIRDVSGWIKRKEWEDFWVIPSREDAIRTALTLAQTGDVIVIAGKWAESVQVTQKWAIPWNDANVVRRILQEIDENKLAV
jgi:UDP-N-acetylmuramoyl-L-alanyl-D-glutamate--2,6-diaminopimelate ligase